MADSNGGEKKIRIHNKSDKPDNIVRKENEIYEECRRIEGELPGFLRNYFAYLRGSVLPQTRLGYLRDVRFFFSYLLESGFPGTEDCEKIGDIRIGVLERMKARDVNTFIDYCRRYEKQVGDTIVVYENDSKSLARKKSSVSVMFKYLYRDEQLSRNITDGFDPIRVPKPGEREIKALQDDEVMRMLDAVSTGTDANGNPFPKKQLAFWEKTKKRDKAILIMFLTYGLRLSELQQLNVSSFNFSRGEFKIYRKRGKEALMPLNESVLIVIREYLDSERASDSTLDEIDRDALFLSLQGHRLTERQIREIVKKYTAYGMMTSREAGYSPHKLRATAATSLIGRGNSIFDVQALLDHEQVTTTQLYAAHKMNVKRDLVKDMEWELERREGSEDEKEK